MPHGWPSDESVRSVRLRHGKYLDISSRLYSRWRRQSQSGNRLGWKKKEHISECTPVLRGNKPFRGENKTSLCLTL